MLKFGSYPVVVWRPVRTTPPMYQCQIASARVGFCGQLKYPIQKYTMRAHIINNRFMLAPGIVGGQHMFADKC